MSYELSARQVRAAINGVLLHRGGWPASLDEAYAREQELTEP
jgi:hypothetical protein